MLEKLDGWVIKAINLEKLVALWHEGHAFEALSDVGIDLNECFVVGDDELDDEVVVVAVIVATVEVRNDHLSDDLRHIQEAQTRETSQ